MTEQLTPDAVEVLKYLQRCLDYLASRLASDEASSHAESADELQRMAEAVRRAERAVRGDRRPPPIPPNADNLVCARCGSAEIECLDWVRVNDDHVVGGNDDPADDDYWCPECEVHERPVAAADYCGDRGHRGQPCEVCGVKVGRVGGQF